MKIHNKIFRKRLFGILFACMLLAPVFAPGFARACEGPDMAHHRQSEGRAEVVPLANVPASTPGIGTKKQGELEEQGYGLNDDADFEVPTLKTVLVTDKLYVTRIQGVFESEAAIDATLEMTAGHNIDWDFAAGTIVLEDEMDHYWQKEQFSTFLPEELTIVATGDMYLGGRVAPYLEKYGPAYPYEFTGDLLRDADMTVVNLEAPITSASEKFVEKKYYLKSGPLTVASLQSAGVDVATLANNHMMDYGEKGLFDTLAALDKGGILHTGAGANRKRAREPVFYTTESGARVAVLAYSYTFPRAFYAKAKKTGTAQGLAGYIRRDVPIAREQAEIVVVSFHWSAEMRTTPKRYQVDTAHLAIDSGADLVVGHHSHTMQSVESYKNGVIFYGLGNFVFGTFSSRTNEGAIAEVIFKREGDTFGVKSARIIPLDVHNRKVLFRPVPLKGERLATMLREIESRSLRFAVAFSDSPHDGSFVGRLASAVIAPIAAIMKASPPSPPPQLRARN